MTERKDDPRRPGEDQTPQPLAEVNKSKARRPQHDPDLGRHGPIIAETASEPTDRGTH